MIAIIAVLIALPLLLPAVQAARRIQFTLAPNKVIRNSLGQGDLDIETRLPVQGGPTYAAITARSYHPGGVNAQFADGSVRFVESTVDGNTWRALGSVQGGEVISADQC